MDCRRTAARRRDYQCGERDGTRHGHVPGGGGTRAGIYREPAFWTIAEQTFTIQQEAASISAVSGNLIGSMPHIAAEENWFTTFTLVNNTASSNQVRLSLFGSNIDASGGGSPLQLPLNLPQQASLGVLQGASLDNTLSANASWIVSTGGQGITPVETGSAQVNATGAAGGIRHFPPLLGRAGSSSAANSGNAERAFLLTGFR